MTQTKTEWRCALMAARQRAKAAVRHEHSAAIAERVRSLAAFRRCAVVLSYRRVGAEVDPAALDDAARAVGKTVYYPLTVDGAPAWGLPPGTGSSPAVVATHTWPEGGPLLVIVPGVGFDEQGGRLGRGGGFYDRALACLRQVRTVVAVGVAFELQIVGQVPMDGWDQAVDLVATERRVIDPGKSTRHGAQPHPAEEGHEP